jgi:hypothetical protein
MPVLAARWSVPGAVESTLEGRIHASDIDELVKGYRSIAGTKVASGRKVPWVVRGEKVSGYHRDAIERAIHQFSELVRDALLDRLVAVLPVPTVRMGATVVSMGMRAAGYPLELIVVSSEAEVAASLSAPHAD